MAMATEIVQSDSVLGSLVKAETDVQIATAKAWPRGIKSFIEQATEMVTMSEGIAGECLYSLKRGGKVIEGPSVRFAEILTCTWGNCRIGARIVGEDDRFITAQGVFADLQSNVVITMEVKRRITNREGERYNEDMVGVTGKAACAIAGRNAVLKGIPKGFWQPIFDRARRHAIGDASTLATKRQQLVAYFGKMGIDPVLIETYVGVPSVDMFTLDNIAALRGLATRIKEGDITLDEAFPVETKTEESDVVSDTEDSGFVDQLVDELDAAPDITEVNAIRDLTLEQSQDDNQRKFINDLCDKAIIRIKAKRGERSNKPEQETT